LVARVAFALRNDLRVKILVPVSKARFVMAIPGSETDTLGTIAITILPSFLTNFSGRAVRIKLAMEGSSVASAAAGKDSGAVTNAPSGAVNQGTIDEKTWKYGHAFDPPPNAKIWNPVKLKLMRGEKVTGGAVSSWSELD